MATVAEYDVLISDAQNEIGYCKQMISIIRDIDGNLINCVKDLNDVFSSIRSGLIVDGVPQGSTIEEKANGLKSFNDILNDSIPLIEARIKELENNIVFWKKARLSLWTYLATLKEKLFDKNEK